MDSVVTNDLIFPYLLRKVTEKAALTSCNLESRNKKKIETGQLFYKLFIAN